MKNNNEIITTRNITVMIRGNSGSSSSIVSHRGLNVVKVYHITLQYDNTEDSINICTTKDNGVEYIFPFKVIK